MKLEEALLSGKPFRRPGWSWIYQEEHHLFKIEDSAIKHFHLEFEYEDLIANDWEIKLEKKKKAKPTKGVCDV